MGCASSKESHIHIPNGNKNEHGTTILAFHIRDGIIIASDKRISYFDDQRRLLRIEDIAPNGPSKVRELGKRILVAMAGHFSAGQELTTRLAEHSFEKDPNSSVDAASSWLKRNLEKQPYHVDVQFIVAGIDQLGPSIYLVKRDELVEHNPYVCTGSGRAHADRILSDCYDYYMDLSKAKKLAKKALYDAMCHDDYTGGHATVWHISRAYGSELVSVTSYEDLHKEFRLDADMDIY